MSNSEFVPNPDFSPLRLFFEEAQRPGTWEREVLNRILIAGAAVVVTIIVMTSLSKGR